jgi:hypothetical protein
VTAAAKRKARKDQNASGPQITPIFDEAGRLRRIIDTELRCLLEEFIRESSDLDRATLREILRHFVLCGEGLRTSFHGVLEADEARVYTTVRREHFELVAAYVGQLEKGNATLQPIGNNWAIWRQAEVNTDGYA